MREERSPSPTLQRKRGDDVDSRIAAATKTAALAEASFAKMSAKKLALLKQLPIGRLARLAPDADLTKADAAELRHWIADRSGRLMSKSGWMTARVGPLRTSRLRLPTFSVVLAGLGSLVILGGMLAASARTPHRYVKLQSATSYNVQLSDGSFRITVLPRSTVVIQDEVPNEAGIVEGRYWVPGEGYRTESFRVNR